MIKDPTWIFFVVLAVILLAPLLLRRLRLPGIVGYIVAGILIGEHGLGLLKHDSSFEIFGQVGIYLIMFIAGLGLDMGSVKRYGREGLVFGLLTFTLPFVMGYAASRWLLHYGVLTSILMACIFSSHTLVSYPVVQRYGQTRHPKVVVSVVATAFTTFLSLLVLAFVINMQHTQTLVEWVWVLLRMIVYSAVMLYAVPRMGRWFLRKYSDSVTQFMFVLLLLFLSAGLASIAGVASLLGAFFCGLLVNRLIPRTSPLMNRIEFFSEAFFVPYFLIGIGMHIDVTTFVSSREVFMLSVVMVVVGLLSKWVAAVLLQVVTRTNSASRLLTFGLSSAHSAGALAIVMIAASPRVGLMGENVLDSIVLLILVSCVVASIATDYGVRNVTIHDARTEDNRGAFHGRCLTLYDNADTLDSLTQMSLMMANKNFPNPIIGLSVTFEDDTMGERHKERQMLLNNAQRIAVSADVAMQVMSRVSTNVVLGIQHTMTEYECGELLLSYEDVDTEHHPSPKSLSEATPLEIVAYRSIVPPATLRRMVLAVPQKAEFEIGFYKWLEHVCRVAENLGIRLCFHAHPDTMPHIRHYLWQHHLSLRAEYIDMELWTRIMSLQRDVSNEDLIIFVVSRPGYMSYKGAMNGLPLQIRRYFSHTNIMIIYPDQGND